MSKRSNDALLDHDKLREIVEREIPGIRALVAADQDLIDDDVTRERERASRIARAYAKAKDERIERCDGCGDLATHVLGYCESCMIPDKNDLTLRIRQLKERIAELEREADEECRVHEHTINTVVDQRDESLKRIATKTTDALLREIVEREVPSLFEVNELEYDWNEVERIAREYARARLEKDERIAVIESLQDGIATTNAALAEARERSAALEAFAAKVPHLDNYDPRPYGGGPCLLWESTPKEFYNHDKAECRRLGGACGRPK